MKLKAVCFYNCLHLASSVILNLQQLGETTLRFDVEKEVITILSLLYLSGQSRDPIERIWTFICPFHWRGEGGRRVRGAIYLIIFKSTVFKHKCGFERKRKRKEKRTKPLINMRRGLVLACKGNKSNSFPGAYLCIACCILMCKPWNFSLLFTFLNTTRRLRCWCS